jgi:hypothetical protein
MRERDPLSTGGDATAAGIAHADERTTGFISDRVGTSEKEIPVLMLDDGPWQGLLSAGQTLHCSMFRMQRALLPVETRSMNGSFQVILVINQVPQDLQDG